MRETSGLLAALAGARVVGTPPPRIDAIASDSRAVGPGTAFVALRGERDDGHEFIGDAIARGAALIVAERAPDTEVPCVLVDDTRIAASALADAFHDRPSASMLVVGVTGTNGKTTTTHLVRDMLESSGVPCGVVGTLGGAFRERSWPLANTTPLAIELHGLLAAMRDAGARAIAMEVSSHALALRRVDHVRFAAAALTNITRDHLDFHGTFERYVAAKRRLFDLAPFAVLNVDDASGAAFAREIAGLRPITYAIDAAAMLRAEEVRLDGDGSHFRVAGTTVAIALPGRFNVRNALAAFGLGRTLGIGDREIARGLGSTKAVPGRMERIGAFGIDAVVDYAHTPDALENVLRAARETTRGRLIVVFGCGGDRDPGKRVQMGEIAARLADRVIVTSDNPRSEDPMAIAVAVATGFPHTDIVLDRRTAIRRAIDDAHAGDTVVVAGKGHETYQIVGADVRPFDDRDEVRNAFSTRAEGARR
ncbi:UDP-N-acetylmuramoyl-L-alanyl-D-glutamate--2,6-diaminopimelate ligase [Vulcanimicrobium alpinum]|uniref:UDP-N-acetylmuramoyl-L-alanyl-D-glutamate--2,6-diaminopimelate ligase n=1 Tax=Vulcanimicrobium alpinum TaxID=3016050 RepID=A0AAN2CAR2_UNVUL|nr:UDP-N-acetylmuramoyl-L-alanyl-D-glutamate--2,6-diaminopimelate ligase [Vulcanimicrobium alpinum]BDE07935.1 UDP-N-acetylmuramoyl-L-alanyl-D-glutamate--2,6-diaminopimelate ligase [Vulcanimicrobium alpinum]